jgi:hypothetical protein
MVKLKNEFMLTLLLINFIINKYIRILKDYIEIQITVVAQGGIKFFFMGII